MGSAWHRLHSWGRRLLAKPIGPRCGCLPLPRRDKDGSKVTRDDESVWPDERPPRGFYTLLTILSERYVSSTCMTAVERPLGFAMANEKHSRHWWSHLWSQIAMKKVVADDVVGGTTDGTWTVWLLREPVASVRMNKRAVIKSKSEAGGARSSPYRIELRMLRQRRYCCVLTRKGKMQDDVDQGGMELG